MLNTIDPEQATEFIEARMFDAILNTICHVELWHEKLHTVMEERLRSLKATERGAPKSHLALIEAYKYIQIAAYEHAAEND